MRTRERRDLAGVGADQKEEGDGEEKDRPQDGGVGRAHRVCDRGHKRVHRVTDDTTRSSALCEVEKKNDAIRSRIKDEDEDEDEG